MPPSLSAQDADKAAEIFDSSTHSLDKLFKAESYYDFKLYWSFLKVGRARLQFSQLESNSSDSEAAPRYQIRFTVQSDPILNSIYPIDTWIESTLFKSNPIKPEFYEKHLKQGEELEHSSLSFDRAAKKIYEIKNGLASKPLDMLDDCQDPLSLILSLCQNDFEKNPMHTQSVTDGGQIIQLKSQLSGNETIVSSVGSFNSQRIDIETQDLRGIFKKSTDAQVFLYLHRVNNSLPALPVKFQSKVAIGNFYALLSGGMHLGHPIQGIEPAKPTLKIRSKDRIFRKFN